MHWNPFSVCVNMNQNICQLKISQKFLYTEAWLSMVVYHTCSTDSFTDHHNPVAKFQATGLIIKYVIIINRHGKHDNGKKVNLDLVEKFTWILAGEMMEYTHTPPCNHTGVKTDWLNLFRRKSAFSHFSTWLHTWLVQLAKCNFCKIF